MRATISRAFFALAGGAMLSRDEAARGEADLTGFAADIARLCRLCRLCRLAAGPPAARSRSHRMEWSDRIEP